MNDEPNIVDKMLQFVYQKEYDDERFVSQEPFDGHRTTQETSHDNLNTSHNEKSLLINVKVFVIADKFDIFGLKEIATSKTKTLLSKSWDTQSFPLSVDLLYGNTQRNDRLLRDAFATAIFEDINKLVEMDGFMRIMQNYGGLAVDVLKITLRERNKEEDLKKGRIKKHRPNF